jgi:hypothetical protein
MGLERTNNTDRKRIREMHGKEIKIRKRKRSRYGWTTGWHKATTKYTLIQSHHRVIVICIHFMVQCKSSQSEVYTPHLLVQWRISYCEAYTTHRLIQCRISQLEVYRSNRVVGWKIAQFKVSRTHRVIKWKTSQREFYATHREAKLLLIKSIPPDDNYKPNRDLQSMLQVQIRMF